MSQDAFSEFASKLNTDESLRAAMAERFGDLRGDIPAEELMTFASDQGYRFSVEEVEEELSEEALEGIAGGLGEVKLELEATTSFQFEEIKVTYSPKTLFFQFIKI